MMKVGKIMYEVYFLENYVVLECSDCGELEIYSIEDFEDMVDEGMIELIEDECDCEDCDECEYFEGEFDEDEYIDEEVDVLLEAIAEEILLAVECGDYDAVEKLVNSYARLYEVL